MDNQKIVDCARTFIGTPYHHQGRVKKAGIDCCGLIICIAKELGLSQFDIDGYSRFADGVELSELFYQNCPKAYHLEQGKIAIFRIKKRPQHCGIIAEADSGFTLIHAYQSAGKVVEHQVSEWWSDRIVQLFSFPSVEGV